MQHADSFVHVLDSLPQWMRPACGCKPGFCRLDLWAWCPQRGAQCVAQEGEPCARNHWSEYAAGSHSNPLGIDSSRSACARCSGRPQYSKDGVPTERQRTRWDDSLATGGKASTDQHSENAGPSAVTNSSAIRPPLLSRGQLRPYEVVVVRAEVAQRKLRPLADQCAAMIWREWTAPGGPGPHVAAVLVSQGAGHFGVAVVCQLKHPEIARESNRFRFGHGTESNVVRP